ncbi:leucine-rich repeat-containing protein 49-like [Topomyia yanbarensis]|uniref:leucine-rich repeat-containing protein 49-like n=1 Tax=Topomyia yanbarensis TaxID=2498891 RepID=UPI00273AA164|nr:leucine-rich repeat-containing protein 49-like [Topomyia yanbarensis]
MYRIIALMCAMFFNLVISIRTVNYTCTISSEGFCIYQGVRINSPEEASSVQLLAPNYELTKVKFRESAMVELPDNIYTTFPKLQELRVWWQSLHSIYIAQNLLHLDAERNRINKISFDTNTVPMLRKLELGHNRLKTIENISYFENLEILDLSHNDLRSIDLCLFQRMKNLRTLDLSVNNMAIVKNSMEDKLESLTVLYLNDNRLSYLDINVLKQFPNLETLHLFNNGLMYMEFENMRSMFPRINIVHIYGNDWNCEILAEMIIYFKKINMKEYKLFNSLKCKEKVVDGICCSDGKALSILKKSNLYFSNYVNELNLHSQHIMQEMKQSKREIQKLIETENMTQASLRAFSDDMSAIRSRIENISTLAPDNSTPVVRPRKHEKVDKLVQEIYKIKQDYQSLSRENQQFKHQIEGYELMKSEMDSLRAYSEEMKAIIKELKEENTHLKGDLYQLLQDFHELKLNRHQKEV